MREQCFNQSLVLHSDNGAPMKSLTFKAKMEELGIISSYSRPRVTDDIPYVESSFRTLKYVPNWPSKGFGSLDVCRASVAEFVVWYNTKDKQKVLMEHRQKRPERWSGIIRNCDQIGEVDLNPGKETA